MKNALFYVSTIVLAFASLILAYYIFVNTYQTDKPLFDYSQNNYVYSYIEVSFLGNKVDVRSRFAPESDQAKQYGRGADLGKVIAEGLDLIDGPDSKKYYSIDTEYLFESLAFPFKIANQDNVHIDANNFLRNCEHNIFNFVFDTEKIKADVFEGTTSLQLDSYLSNSDQVPLIQLCEEYNTAKSKVAAVLAPYFNNVEEILNYSVTTRQFEIADETKLRQKVQELSDTFTSSVIDPVYEEVNGSIYLLSFYENGYALDFNQTVENLQNFLSGTSTGFNVETYAVKPAIFASGKPVYDFSNEIAQGQTRMELIRNGYTNWVIQFADFGLYEVNNYVIQPGEEFSFLNTIQPNNGVTKSGFPIAGGICNSTTTLFRAALEAGLPITERYYHYSNVPSYDWPYKMNIVDSAYFTDPKVDLKFVNDTGYPILIRFEKSQKDGYQYNTVKLMTNSDFKKRKVELTNWRKWNEYSPTHFEASFDRIVFNGDTKIREDNFYSRYLD